MTRVGTLETISRITTDVPTSTTIVLKKLKSLAHPLICHQRCLLSPLRLLLLLLQALFQIAPETPFLLQ
jgi:hypothetical protein